ncbi:hypothetical protein T492DRAFT_1145824 [Pavlovales sp. CCMP2436]|nr:hypothetical protein T492DRAFT_1145824 [Pavlovales sp. CCMP2436]
MSLLLFALACSMAGGASDDSEISPSVTPPRVARHGGLGAADGATVGEPARARRSFNLLRMLCTGLGFDKQNASDADDAELIVARWTGDTKDTGNYKVSVFHFDAASIYFTPKTVAFSKVERKIWPSIEPGLVRARTQLALAGTAPAMAFTHVPDGVPSRLAPEERDLHAGKRAVGELAAGGRSPTVPKLREKLEVSEAERLRIATLLAAREQECAKLLSRAEDAELACAAFEKAAKQTDKPDFIPWHTYIMAPGKRLGPLVRSLTTFESLNTFTIRFRPCATTRAAMWPAPRGRPTGSTTTTAPSTTRPTSSARRCRGPRRPLLNLTSSTKWPQQLKSSKPAGLLPIEACFMTMASLRLGIGVKETSSLFGISAGSVHQQLARPVDSVADSGAGAREHPGQVQGQARCNYALAQVPHHSRLH